MEKKMEEEVTNPFKEELFFRLKSPLYGTFILAWMLVNIELFYFIFTADPNMNYSVRLDYIEANILNSHWKQYTAPIIATILKIFVFDGLVLTQIKRFYIWLSVIQRNGKTKLDQKELVFRLEGSIDELNSKLKKIDREDSKLKNHIIDLGKLLEDQGKNPEAFNRAKNNALEKSRKLLNPDLPF